MNKSALIFLACLLSFAGCKSYESITVKQPGWFPEGIAYDASRDGFLVTSVNQGTVTLISRDGKASIFINDKRFISTVGIKVDAKRNRILVANGDPTVGIRSRPDTKAKLAGLGVYDLKSGKLIRYVNLAKGLKGGRLANDLILDAKGNIYVTDSFSPSIYKVDLNYSVSVFLSSPKFKGKGFNLNGLAYHAQGNFLLAAKTNEGKLFRIPLGKPNSFTEVKTAGALIGADGLVLLSDGRLAVVRGAVNQVDVLASRDDWKSAGTVRILKHKLDFPTTATLAGNRLMIVNAKLDRLFTGKGNSVKQFEIISLNPNGK